MPAAITAQKYRGDFILRIVAEAFFDFTCFMEGWMGIKNTK
jgi:hypothetical protein